MGTNENRSYWRWSKDDFFPGESFQNWTNYGHALSETCHRFKDRLLARSDELLEVTEVRKRSINDMKRCLTWWDLMWFGFGSVIGTGIFVLTGQEAQSDAGPAIVLSYVISGFSAMLSVFCYTEFAIEIPAAGGSFAFLRVELGDFASFIAAANILLESIIGAGAVARSWTSYFATLINLDSNALRIHVHSFPDGYNYLDPIAVVVLWIASMTAMTGTRRTSLINWLLTLVNTLAIVLVIVASFCHAKESNLVPFFPFGTAGVFRAAAVVFFAYTGFEGIATMAEETKNPAKDIPLGLMGCMSIVTVVYCLMSLSLVMMQNYKEIDPNAAYSVAFAKVGMKWVKVLVALGALKSMTTVLLVGALTQARYTAHIARAHMLPPLFALVHPKTLTPVHATLLVTFLCGIVALFSSLDILSNLLSISTLFIFMMVAVALLVRRYYLAGATPRANLLKLVLFLFIIIGSSIATTTYWALRPNGWICYTITLPLWFLGTSGIALVLPQQRVPKVWGVPLVPWFPCLSIAVNIFLMGSLDYRSFIRFGICTLIMIIYYMVFIVHATYDAAHEQRKVEGLRGAQDPVQQPVEA